MLLLRFAFEYNLEVQRRIMGLRLLNFIYIYILHYKRNPGLFDPVISCHRFLRIIELCYWEMFRTFELNGNGLDNNNLQKIIAVIRKLGSK